MTDGNEGRRKDRLLAGCIPCSEDGNSVLMVTSRAFPDQLVFPKGGVKNGETEAQAAVRETLEEAGVRGRIREGPIVISEIVWYELVVIEELSDWQEKSERERQWVRK